MIHTHREYGFLIPHSRIFDEAEVLVLLVDESVGTIFLDAGGANLRFWSLYGTSTCRWLCLLNPDGHSTLYNHLEGLTVPECQYLH